MKIIQKDIIKQIKIESSNQIITCKLGHLYLLCIENVLLLKVGIFLRLSTSHFSSFLVGSAYFTVNTTRETWQREKREERATKFLIVCNTMKLNCNVIIMFWLTSLRKDWRRISEILIYSCMWKLVLTSPTFFIYVTMSNIIGDHSK